MLQTLDAFMNENKKKVIEEFRQQLHALDIPSQLKESMLYSMEAGGKRLRPILLAASFEAYSKDNANDKIYRTALALEMIHTYSLIHDDLPAMDDDDLRRGKPTNHKVFDEATAILAGDALLTYSFELIAEDPLLTDAEKIYLTKELSKAGGPSGMVAGQILDMEAENAKLSLEQLENVHKLKTGELISFAITAGAYLGGASDEQIKHLGQYAYYLGLIFQVQDDILDVTGDPAKIGKPVGSDEGNNKSTYPSLLGLDGAVQQKNIYVDKAKHALESAMANTSYLMELTAYFSQRDA